LEIFIVFWFAWIAGYSSDAAPRQIFGSMRNLRNLFIKLPKKIDGVEFSWKDLQRGITLPEKMSPELAEETGIHLGDGSLSKCLDKGGYLYYKYSVTGDMKDESIYHDQFIVPLIKKLYNILPSILKRPNKNRCGNQN